MADAAKVAIVTGSAQGIGHGIALRLAADGFNVALNDIPSKEETLNEVAAEIRSRGRKALVLVGDVTVEKSVEEIVSKAVTELGRLDVVCHLFLLFDS